MGIGGIGSEMFGMLIGGSGVIGGAAKLLVADIARLVVEVGTILEADGREAGHEGLAPCSDECNVRGKGDFCIGE